MQRDEYVGQRDRHLLDFCGEMLAKFLTRRERHARSVTAPDFDWATELSIVEIERHMGEEIAEWLEEGADRAAEDVDLANLAFLDWMARRARRDDAR